MSLVELALRYALVDRQSLSYRHYLSHVRGGSRRRHAGRRRLCGYLERPRYRGAEAVGARSQRRRQASHRTPRPVTPAAV